MKKIKTEYNKGDKTEGGWTLVSELGCGPWFIVFRCEDGTIRWEIDDDYEPEHFRETLAVFDELHSKVLSCIPLRRNQKKIEVTLGRALFNGMVAPSAGEGRSAFDEARARIEHEVTIYSRLNYVIASTLIAVASSLFVMLAFVFEVRESILVLLLGAAAGALGALLSILLRSTDVVVAPYATPLRQLFQGACRALFGSICGVVLVFLVKANLVLGQCADSRFALGAFSVVAGFSERFLPNLLAGLEKSGGQNGPD